jgi:hypothetical protein
MQSIMISQNKDIHHQHLRSSHILLIVIHLQDISISKTLEIVTSTLMVLHHGYLPIQIQADMLPRMGKSIPSNMVVSDILPMNLSLKNISLP